MRNVFKISLLALCLLLVPGLAAVAENEPVPSALTGGEPPEPGVDSEGIQVDSLWRQ